MVCLRASMIVVFLSSQWLLTAVFSHFFRHLDVLLCHCSLPTLPRPFPCLLLHEVDFSVPLWERSDDDRDSFLLCPCVFCLLPSSLLFPKICHLLYPRILCSKQRPLIHPDSLLSLSPLSNLFQTYQQSSSLQSKNRKKNKGKLENHLFSSHFLLPKPLSCLFRRSFSLCPRRDAEVMAAESMRAAASAEPSILLTL